MICKDCPAWKNTINNAGECMAMTELFLGSFMTDGSEDCLAERIIKLREALG